MMMGYLKHLVLCAVLIVAASSGFAMSLPKMQGETLDKTERVYPEDFKGKPTVMIILFDRDQQAQMDGWAAASDALPDGVGMVEIALIGKVGGIAKFFITGGMRDAIGDDKERLGRMMPYFGDADKVKKALAIDDISEVAVFLLSPSGKVLWQASGDYDGQFTDLPIGG